jgi:tetratricopeptide (TPR) repeat protein
VVYRLIPAIITLVVMAGASAAPLVATPAGGDGPRTTSIDIHLGNLDAQIEVLSKSARRHPKQTGTTIRLSAFLYRRAMYHGDLDGIAAAIAQLDQAIALSPSNAGPWLLRARQSLSLHRFSQAQADLQQAAALGAQPSQLLGVRQEIDWYQGRYDAATTAIREAAALRPGLRTLARLAQLDYQLGRIDQAGITFAAARRQFRGTNPVVLAWLDVQHGILELETCDYPRAEAWFRRALRRAPGYVLAREHLAESLGRQGRSDEAIALYTDILQISDNPEFMGALALLLRQTGQPQAADHWRRRARERYRHLLQRYPEAMYWHAAGFFADIDDNPQRALELLEKNVELRPNTESYAELARIQLALGQTARARASLMQALDSPVRSAKLYRTAAAVLTAGGEPSPADRMSRQARQLCGGRLL